MNEASKSEFQPNFGNFHPDFDALVHDILDEVGATTLGELRSDFHTRLRISLTQPDNESVIEDLWDFFYDWCFFDQNIPSRMELPDHDQSLWKNLSENNLRGLFQVAKINDKGLRLKELVSGKTYILPKGGSPNVWGLSRSDIIEARLIPYQEGKKTFYEFIRRPSFHPHETHAYLKAKVKEFKKLKDEVAYQAWLWLVVSMYLKHRIYQKISIANIYDDNSRI